MLPKDRDLLIMEGIFPMRDPMNTEEHLGIILG